MSRLLKIAGLLILVVFQSVQGQNDTSKMIFMQYTFPDGKVSSEGYLRNNQPDGYWKTFYENGNIKSEGNRKNYLLDSIWKFYNEDGKIILEIHYDNNLKEGIRTTYMENEILIENFEKDIKQGKSKFLYPDGRLKKDIFYLNGLEEGFSKEYDTNGQVITLYQYKKGFLISREIVNRMNSSGNKQGNWMYFYDNGNIMKSEEWRNGVLNGFVKEFDLNGNLKTISKYVNGEPMADAEEIKNYDLKYDYYEDGKIKIMGSYRYDKPDGIRREYNEAGKIIRGYVYRNGIMIAEGIIDERGLKQGKFTEYFENGQVMAEGKYADSKPVGYWKYFYQDGTIEQEGNFDNRGQHEGLWTWYYQNGNIWKTENYENGLSEGEYLEYDISGKITVKGQYFDGEETGKWLWEIGDVREEGSFTDGQYSGEWKTTDLESGKILFQGKYLDGNPNGKHIYYRENGQKKFEGHYVMGQREGEWYYFNEDGTVLVKISYRGGVEQKYNNVTLQPSIED